jgi:glycosyltransferase involved in cell wall biosynthesis
MGNNFPNVAIVCANYNYGKFIVAAMKSIMSQTYKGKIRLYVVDDGSTDNSWELISEYAALFSDKIFPIRIQNSGASAARNLAIEYAIEWAEIIGILDADDAYMPNKVAVLVNKLVEHDEIGVAYGDYMNVFPEYSKLEFKSSYSKIGLLQKCMVHSNSLIKKKYLQQAKLPNGDFFDRNLHGPASKDFIGCTEDYDLWIRLSNLCIITHVPECLAIANQHGNNQSMKMTAEIFNQNTRTMMERK